MPLNLRTFSSFNRMKLRHESLLDQWGGLLSWATRARSDEWGTLKQEGARGLYSLLGYDFVFSQRFVQPVGGEPHLEIELSRPKGDSDEIIGRWYLANNIAFLLTKPTGTSDGDSTPFLGEYDPENLLELLANQVLSSSVLRPAQN